MVCSLAPLAASSPVGPTVAHAQTTKQKIRTAYKKKAKAIAKSSQYRGYADYKFVDVYGNSGEELIVMTQAKAGSGNYFFIYTYANGKVKLLLKEGFGGKCPVTWFRFYKKGKSFIIQRRGWGMEIYYYYQIKGGKYHHALTRSRQSKLAGAAKNGPWSYYDCIKNINLTKAQFAKRTKTIAIGARKTVNAFSGWNTIAS